MLEGLLFEKVIAWLSSLSATTLLIYYFVFKATKKLLKWIIVLGLVGCLFFLISTGTIPNPFQ